MSSPVRLDRRQLRRAETLEQLVEVAVDVMAEHGVAGLSLGEVARRMGLRTPSLYVYFPSKHALYDAVFAQGWRAVKELLEAHPDPEPRDDLPAYLLGLAEVYVRWSLEHPVHAQLMTWRPVPGYEPSPEAYAHSLAAFGRTRHLLERLQVLGLFQADVDPDELMKGWTVLSSGVVTRQLANAPTEGFDEGTFSGLLVPLVDMFARHYAPLSPARPTKPKEPRHAGPRPR
jgi:AcrR family transcriptional regulator